MVSCPFRRGDGLSSSLSDDLVSLWHDVKEGVLVHAKDSPKARRHAIWTWRFDFHHHWAHHAVVALSPLAWIMSDEFTD